MTAFVAMTSPPERPILFSAPMIRAILSGAKTQTRRIVRIDDRPVIVKLGSATERTERQRGIPTNAENVRMVGHYLKCDAPPGSNTVSSRVPCPYGFNGDRLWVKETWQESDSGPPLYRADYESDEHAGVSRWRPSIFMRRDDSRITLEIVSVRAERLHEITEEDARAEGVVPAPYDPQSDTNDCWTDGKYRTAFEYTWGQINGWDGEPGARAPWGTNPWVWRLEFRRTR
jgi:hypothetical protein